MKITNMRELCSAIAAKEGKKSEVSIGDIREVMRVFSDLIIEQDKTVLDIFVTYSTKRANRIKKKC